MTAPQRCSNCGSSTDRLLTCPCELSPCPCEAGVCRSCARAIRINTERAARSAETADQCRNDGVG